MLFLAVLSITTLAPAAVGFYALRRPKMRGLKALAIVVGGWICFAAGVFVIESHIQAETDARIARYEHVTEEEALADGTGENSVALFLGWLPPTIGVTGVISVRRVYRDA